MIEYSGTPNEDKSAQSVSIWGPVILTLNLVTDGVASKSELHLYIELTHIFSL